MCVPYGMWGLKTQQVIQSERIIVNLKVGVSLRKRKLLKSVENMLSLSCPFKIPAMERVRLIFFSTADMDQFQCVQTPCGIP